MKIRRQPHPLGRKQNFNRKDCVAWNQYKEVLSSGGKNLTIPNDPNPWNCLRAVIDQFYE